MIVDKSMLTLYLSMEGKENDVFFALSVSEIDDGEKLLICGDMNQHV